MSDQSPLHKRVNNISGMKFGRLTVTKHIGRLRPKSRNHFWEAICDCGKVVQVMGTNLIAGDTKSCGCLQREKARRNGPRNWIHGLTKTTTYNIWDSMLQRCNNPKRKDYPRYGGAGITVSERWQEFSNFLADMGERPPGLTLDRIDSKLGYSRENCRWATVTEQNRNQKSNRFFTHNGMTKCMSEWAEYAGMKATTFETRIRKGWSLEDAISKPVRHKNKCNK